MPEQSFADLMSQVQAGDSQAAAELLERYGSEVRRVARLRLRRARAKQIFQSSDAVQEVMMSLFVRARQGEYEGRLQSPDEFLKLINKMVRYKVLDQERRELAAKRGGKLAAVELFESMFAPTGELSPSEEVVRKELIGLIHEDMSDDEWQVWQLKYGEKLEWNEIASRLGGTGEGHRKKIDRLKERLRQTFGDRDSEQN